MKQPKQKNDMITFKVERSLLDAMRGIPNRSGFIRDAVLSALQSACPLCKGTGILTPNQKKHWDLLGRDHFLEDCSKCHEVVLACGKSRRREGKEPRHG